jgi:hypothetical protein
MIRCMRDYPREIEINDKTWTVRFLRQWPWSNFDDRTVGFCDPEDCTLYIRMGQTPTERFKTFIHELLHALEYSYPGLKIPHGLIDKLEDPLRKLLLDNGLVA